MIILYLLFADIIIPFLISFSMSFIFYGELNIIYIKLSILFSISIIMISLFKRYYENYFITHFSEKIKIAFVTWIFAILIQLIILNILSFKVNPSLILIWIITPMIILTAKYFIRININNTNEYFIHIVGNYYLFNDYEIKLLREKGFVVFFYDTFEKYSNTDNYKNNNDVLVLNIDIDLNSTKKKFSQLQNITILNLHNFFEKYLRKIYISKNNKYQDIHGYNRPSYLMKRIVDLLALVFFLPILLLISIYIVMLKKISNINDTTFFIQKRCGLNNSQFNIFKLRTMNENSESSGNTIKDDTRIYSFAKTIRRLRLDELPQIFNILLGDMHLVGPRAEWIKLVSEYQEHISNYHLRHKIRPGITGWAQIMYPYGFDLNDAKQKFMYDLYYIKHWSIWLELEICIKTFLVILQRKGV